MRQGGAALALLLALALAGCGATSSPPPSVRTVLVVQPGAAPGMAGAAFAGEVRARRESPLSFRVGGNLLRRLVGNGDRVQRGQVLAELDPGDANLQMAAAKADMDRLGGDLARYRTLQAQQLVSRSAFDAQQAAYVAARAKYELMRNQGGYTQLRAPEDGVIASRQAEAGQVVAAGQSIFVLAGSGGRDVVINLPEARIRDFQTGQQALIEPWNAPGTRLTGHIREIAAASDPQTRTYNAKVALDDDAQAQVALGQSVRVFIVGDRAQPELRLPLAAIQGGVGGAGDAAMVWVVDASGHVRSRSVRVGAFGDDSVPVTSGVQPGDWVVAAGGHLLHDGEAVHAVDRRNRPVATSNNGKAR